jgi:hypothetical protein
VRAPRDQAEEAFAATGYKLMNRFFVRMPPAKVTQELCAEGELSTYGRWGVVNDMMSPGISADRRGPTSISSLGERTSGAVPRIATVAMVLKIYWDWNGYASE